jgi:eukaryotic-like serine/threonine-protein kinase
VENGRLIQERYRLQQLIKEGQTAAVYYGWDETLSRAVAVKVVPVPQMPAYRAAIKLTSHFSHPNIISMYDLVIETDRLCVVQEYIEGEDFAALMQKQLTPFAVADLGCQLCQALIYAGSPSRRVAHGDLTPSAVIRDNNGFVRINNFALPSDMSYFQRWSVMGGDGSVISDTELPWGTWSEDRQADDTRAAGLLLYQLLASRTPGTTIVEPRPDGRLSFQRNVPPEMCEVVARAVARQHPNVIPTPEALYVELKTLAETLEPVLSSAPVAARQDEPVAVRQFSPAGGKLATALPVRDTDRAGIEVAAHRPGQSARLPAADVAPSSPTVADASVKLAAARQAAYPDHATQNQGRSTLLMILLICLIVFVALFLVGFFAGQHLIPQ